jgi:Fe-coproporphyrin III synthase
MGHAVRDGDGQRQRKISAAEMLKRQLTRSTHRIYTLPVVILKVTGRCNCRCLMCDIWQAGGEGPQLTAESLQPHLPTLRKLGVQHVVLSGGEPLLHPGLWELCALLRAHGATKITLLSSGLLLAQQYPDVLRWCDAVIVSLDGSRAVHNAIRNVPRAYERLAEGVAALKAAEPGFPVTARCVIQRRNYANLLAIVAAAHEMGLEGTSFLAADVWSTAFDHPEGGLGARAAGIALDPQDVAEFERVLEDTMVRCAADLESGYIAESEHKLRRLARYAAAVNGEGDFPPAHCNAPWVSAVIEADGTVRPCFFRRPLGNLHEQPLARILNSREAVAFRRALDVAQDPKCRKCVCSLHLGLRADVLA